MAIDRQRTIIFYGRSGAGKGTQAKLLKEWMEQDDPDRLTLYVETGQKFREFMTRNNYTAQKVEDVLAEGGLLPEFLPIWVWTNFLIENYTGVEHLILDGISRRVSEAPVLDAALKFYHLDKPDVILIDTSLEWAKERLLGRGRADDTEEDIKERLEWYEENVVPTIDFFRDNPDYNFVEVNGEQSIEGVHKDIVSKLL